MKWQLFLTPCLVTLSLFSLVGCKSTLSYRLMENIEYGQTEWTVQRAVDLGNVLTTENVKGFNITIDDMTTSGRFVEVYWVVQNTSDQNINISTNPVIIDANNREYQLITDFKGSKPIDSGTGFYLGSPLLGMPPYMIGDASIPYRCLAFFNVSADATELKLKIPDLSSESTKIITVDLDLD